jgi:hypothetical protein
MKEIKYQIFHKPTKTIQVVAAIDFNNKVVDTYGIDEPIYGIPFRDLEWRQYADINDKEENYIYTRDIVVVDRLDSFSSFNCGYVYFCQGSFRINIIKKPNNPEIFSQRYTDGTLWMYLTDWKGLKIIGNLDQNLLEVTKDLNNENK